MPEKRNAEKPKSEKERKAENRENPEKLMHATACSARRKSKDERDDFLAGCFLLMSSPGFGGNTGVMLSCSLFGLLARVHHHPCGLLTKYSGIEKKSRAIPTLYSWQVASSFSSSIAFAIFQLVLSRLRVHAWFLLLSCLFACELLFVFDSVAPRLLGCSF
jgi:hypothetical protein